MGGMFRMKLRCGRWGWIGRRQGNEFCLGELPRAMRLRSRRGHRMAHRQLEDLDVIAERFRMQILELRVLLAQLVGEIDSPSHLNNPERITRLKTVGLHQSLPFPGEIVSQQ